MSRRKERLLDHYFDGIQEYDNPTPGWWHMLFLGSVLFSAFYVAFWHFSELSWMPKDALAQDQQRYYKLLFAGIGELEGDEATMRDYMQKPDWMAFGRSIYASNCAQCHGAEGNGINCPNLTDDHWINVKKLTDLYGVVTNGVASKGMPAWGNRMTQNERVLVASFVATLRSTPKPGRQPEGDVIPAWPASGTAAAADASKAAASK
jgi:cytochrome c oxidase cbb3-type subunit 3